MENLARGARYMLVVLSHHGLVQLLVMNAIEKIPIPWELFQNSTEEEIEATVAARAEEAEAMQEDESR